MAGEGTPRVSGVATCTMCTVSNVSINSPAAGASEAVGCGKKIFR